MTTTGTIFCGTFTYYRLEKRVNGATVDVIGLDGKIKTIYAALCAIKDASESFTDASDWIVFGIDENLGNEYIVATGMLAYSGI